METTKQRGRPLGTCAQKSDAVKRVRSALGLTQMELAIQIGCSLSAVQRMERNETLPAQNALKESLSRAAKRAGVPLESTKTQKLTL